LASTKGSCNPVTSKVVDMNKLYSLCLSNSVLREEHSYNLPPIFTTFDPRWKIRTSPRLTGKNTLDVLEGQVAQPAYKAPLAEVLAKASSLVWVKPPSPHTGWC
jgi:hypothetical protein